MNRPLTSVAINYEHDVVLARQRARQIAELLGFDRQDQVRIATAVSEIARNAFAYAQKGRAEFVLTPESPPAFQIEIRDSGPGIRNLDEVLSGSYVSETGMGLGIIGARRLMDDCEIHSDASGTRVILRKVIPRKKSISTAALASLAEALARTPPHDPFEEIQRQNQELLATLAEVQRQKEALTQLNKELEDTNRGVVALYGELDQRADYLHRASELKTQFLSNMTHEFRTPLNSILSLSRMLLDRLDGDLSPDQEKQVRFIQSSATSLSELVNDLLDLAKVEAGKVVVRPGDFLVTDLFGALRGMLRPLLPGNSGVSLVFEDAGALPLLHTDENKVSQILRNLLSNALKFTEKGEVRVSAVMADATWIEFQVADTGIGIAPEHLEKVFEEFTQVEGEHQKGLKGTGLGLPLSRKLAELLGGTLIVKSEPNTGSTFTLRIPVRYEGPSEAVLSPLPDRDPARLPVLAVEDNEEALFIYEKYLQNSGFQFVPASSLAAARQALKRFRPAAIILDVLMGRGSNWDFLAELKQTPETKDIPVLVVTLVDNEPKAAALGADAFHTKPITREWLLQHLQPQQARGVLVVDDDEAARYLLTSAVEKAGYRALSAGTGSEALDLARRLHPSAIFLDLAMPDMNGFQVLDALKADPATEPIPVIIRSGKRLNASDRKKLQGRVVTVLTKAETDQEATIRTVTSALSQAQPK